MYVTLINLWLATIMSNQLSNHSVVNKLSYVAITVLKLVPTHVD